ncbi:hypothetical protein DO97_14880 [Neosynechococcus sphagnicola sy1]|uniref:Uncharacterized protein n=1 Tax=Neosynechococcus sphagnicola sy1 TaxID=1497020 RepID=A0A098TLW4_9CYAN|nr:hypothetical protein DO97_14880 [Neosynechococcus sphagnicola sy1]
MIYIANTLCRVYFTHQFPAMPNFLKKHHLYPSFIIEHPPIGAFEGQKHRQIVKFCKYFDILIYYFRVLRRRKVSQEQFFL